MNSPTAINLKTDSSTNRETEWMIQKGVKVELWHFAH